LAKFLGPFFPARAFPRCHSEAPSPLCHSEEPEATKNLLYGSFGFPKSNSLQKILRCAHTAPQRGDSEANRPQGGA